MILSSFGVLLFIHYTTVETVRVAENYWTLQPNVLVVEVDVKRFGRLVQVPISCGEAFEGQEVIWRKNDLEDLKERGNRIMITVEERLGATYTCYDTNRTPLNHTLVLVQWPLRKIIKKKPDGGYIHCLANNYKGSFQCSWTWDENRAGHVAVVQVKRSNGAEHISCTVDSSGHRITCKDKAYCPYVEEVESINLTLHVRSNHLLESYSKQFYITDIVKPDQVAIKRVSRTTLELKYPRSWNTPFSYFPLTFQVKEIRCKQACDCESSEHKSAKLYTTETPQLSVKRGVMLCVRAKDPLCNSSWSEWSQYKNKRRRNEKKNPEWMRAINQN